MTKLEILERLYVKKGEESNEIHKVQINNICDIVYLMQESDLIREVPELITYVSNGLSRLDGDIFETILNKLRAWVRRQGQIREVTSVGDDWLGGQHHKNFIVSVLFVTVFAIFAAIVFVFSILDNCGILNTSGLVSGICGSLDFLFGVSFFIYEWINDKKVKTMYNEMSEITGIVYYESKFKIKGNGNNFGAINSEAVCDIEEQARKFVIKYGKSKIKVNGNDNNFGIKN